MSLEIFQLEPCVGAVAVVGRNFQTTNIQVNRAQCNVGLDNCQSPPKRRSSSFVVCGLGTGHEMKGIRMAKKYDFDDKAQRTAAAGTQHL